MSASEDSHRSQILLDGIRRGDQIAFAEFIRAHEQRAASIIGRVLDDPRDVAEATQDTFVQVWRNASQFRGDAAVTTWLHRIAMNTALTRARRKHRPQTSWEEASSLPLLDATDATAQDAEQRRRAASVRAALAQLPLDQRAAVVLRDIEGLSSAEAAAVLDLAEPALKTRLHRGRMRLRSLLADHAADAES
ncbi:MAG TPA: sigma-70 family RNA polymerase sigma factor [Acidimicrobiales bacterium]|nr:sigma-70 family RNA polymerase sigma factor [Acidimicrobiales bacterium]